MVVRGYYDVYVSDEEVDINDESTVIAEAKNTFDYDIQDRCIHSGKLTWKVIKENNTSKQPDSEFDIIKFKRRCYELYQLDWLKTHGYTLQDAFDVLREGYIEGCDSGDIDGGTGCDDDFNSVEEYFEEHGFNGEIFACEKEFYDCEYHDAGFMEYLLPKDMFEQYINCQILVKNDMLGGSIE